MASGLRVRAYDLVIVGGGVFGLSIAGEAGRRGRRTLMLERRSIPNPVAASYGPSRKIRSTYGDPHYARLAREAMVAWRKIEAEVGVELYLAVGNLCFTTLDTQPRLDELEAVSRSVEARVRLLHQAELQAEFPQFRTARRALLEVDAGLLRASACVEALRMLAERSGVEVATEQEVLGIEPSGDGLKVRSTDLQVKGSQVVVAGGGWSSRLFPELKPALWQSQQGIAYVADAPSRFTAPAFPAFSCADNGYYGFPIEPGYGLKVAHHVLGEPISDPDFDRGTTPAGFIDGVKRFLSDDLGIDIAQSRLRFESCMYNLSPASDFLLDFHPSLSGLFFATAGSGHGFKFGSNLGRIVLDRLDGIADDRWSHQFSFTSFMAASPIVRPR